MEPTTPARSPGLNHFDLNASLNLYSPEGKLQLDKDREAVRQYFRDDINQNTRFFHNLEEKLEYLVENNFYESEVLDLYDFAFIKACFKQAYAHKFRFRTFLGAYKYYTMYTLRSNDGTRILERFEDRVVMNALYLGNGDRTLATQLVDEIITGAYQPATPTFLNAGKKQRGEMVSCFLIRTEDNMESIGRSINSALQLSKRGGGVALCITNLREAGAPIKGLEGRSAGPVKVMKMYEDAFTYADQLGQRQGAGAVYVSVHHPDIVSILDTKRENADEKIRIKTLSIGLVLSDRFMEQAGKNEDVYLFSPYDIHREYGVFMSDMSITEHYDTLVDNPKIRKRKINARQLMQQIAEVQQESGYPYFMYEDHVNAANPNKGRISMSNLCTEILQTSTPSVLNEDLSYEVVGKDISCNLGSMNVEHMLRRGNVAHSVEVATRALTTVTDLSNIKCVPSIDRGNKMSHAIGLGQMNLHGFFGVNGIHYDSKEALDFIDKYFMMINYWSLRASAKIACERHETYDGFDDSKYASGEYFEPYTSKEWEPETEKVREVFAKYGITLPTRADWKDLEQEVAAVGLYHAYRLAIAPTGSISYINDATSSIHPITAKIEIRKEGKLGRLYYPAFGLNDTNGEFYTDAYEIGYKPLIRAYAAANPHVDQGLSLTVFMKDTATTRDINMMQIFAHARKIRTIYYIRTRQKALEGTDVKNCVSCEV